ncbi:MAG: RidA family protein [Flavobacteriaceae bacterium]
MKSIKSIVLLAVMTFLFSCQNQQNTAPNFIKSQHESRHSAPFSDAVEVNGLLFLTGQVGKDHRAGKVAEGGIEGETRQVLNNIKDVLEANGSDMSHVVKCTVILSDINDFGEMNKVYRTFFTDTKPARTTFAADLVPGYKIEIEVVAAKK